MLELLRDLVAPKAEARIVLRGDVSTDQAYTLQSMIRQTGLLGVMFVRPFCVTLELEGSKPKIEGLMVRIQNGRLAAQVPVMEVHWLPASSRFHDFRVSL